MSYRTVRHWLLVILYGKVSHMAISNVLQNSKATIIFYGKVTYMNLSNVVWNSKSDNYK